MTSSDSICNLEAPVLLNFGALSNFSKGITCYSCLFGNQALSKDQQNKSKPRVRIKKRSLKTNKYVSLINKKYNSQEASQTGVWKMNDEHFLNEYLKTQETQQLF